MDTEHSFQLINGRFEPNEALALLKSLLEAKVSFHRGNLSADHTFEESVEASERRIIEIEKNWSEVQELVKRVKDSGGRVDIETTVTIHTAN